MMAIYRSLLIISYFLVINIGAGRSEELKNLKPSNNFNSKNQHKTAASNSTEINLIYNGECSRYGTCKLNADKQMPVCYCDELCQVLRDCCHDAYINLDIQHFETNFDKQNLECTDGFGFLENTGFRIYTISRCPDTYSITEVSQKCKHGGKAFPVTSNIGITYKNAYCAICHNVSDYHEWTLYYSGVDICDPMTVQSFASIQDQIDLILKNNCEDWYVEPHIPLRFCMQNIRFGKNGTMANETLCSKFHNPVTVKMRISQIETKIIANYFNIFCYEDTIPDGDTYTLCITPKRNRPFQSISDATITGIFNVRPVLELFGQKLCKPDEVFNDIHDICLPKNCENLDEGGCVVERIQNYRWILSSNITYWTNHINDISTGVCLRSMFVFFLSLPREKYGISLPTVTGSFHCNDSSSSQNKCCVFYGSASFILFYALTRTEINHFVSKAGEIEWLYEELVMNGSIIASTLNENKHDRGICRFNNESSTTIHFDSFLRYFKKGWRFKTERSENKIPKSYNVTIVVDEKPITLGSAYADFSIRNFTIVYNATETDIFNISNIRFPKVIPLESILSYITIGISEICLFVTMVIYGMLDMIKSSSGVISVNIMANMFFAQALYVLGAAADYIKELCLTIGIVTHYIWLCAFSWCTIFLVNVARTMRRIHTQPGKNPQQNNLSKVTICIAYGLPLTIVIPSALFDVFSIFHIGYAGKVCFPTGFPANLFVFTIPVLLCIIINIIVLSITIVSISRFNDTTKSTEAVINLRSYIPVYIKLGLICACPFLIGIAADIVDSNPLRYIYIILAGLQGMFTSICFLHNKTVKTKIKQFFSK